MKRVFERQGSKKLCYVRLCDEVESYLGDRVSAGGGCEAVVTART